MDEVFPSTIFVEKYGNFVVPTYNWFSISPEAFVFCSDRRDKEVRYLNTKIRIKYSCLNTNLQDYSLGINTYKAFWRTNSRFPVFFKCFDIKEIPLKNKDDLTLPIFSACKLRHQLQAKIINKDCYSPIVFDYFSLRLINDFYLED